MGRGESKGESINVVNILELMRINLKHSENLPPSRGRSGGDVLTPVAASLRRRNSGTAQSSANNSDSILLTTEVSRDGITELEESESVSSSYAYATAADGPSLSPKTPAEVIQSPPGFLLMTRAVGAADGAEVGAAEGASVDEKG